MRFAALRVADGLLDLIAENLVFHNTILEAAASERLAAMVRKVVELPLVYRSFYWYSPEQKLMSDHYHQQLTHAIQERDPERAELIMKEHVFEARDFSSRCARSEAMTVASDPPTRTRRAEGPGPLAGVRVIELGMLLAGPFTGRLLGDMGAEIIKVEPPGQPDPIREWGKARYKGARCGARAVAQQEVRHPEPPYRSGPGAPARAREAERRARGELPPGNARALEPGLGAPERGEPAARSLPGLRLRPDGPYAERAGFASVAEAMGGIRYVNGFPGEPPPRLHLSLGDSLAGMFAAQGVLSALYWRDALGGGRGQVVDVSLMESCFALLEGTVPEYDRLGVVRGPRGHRAEGRRAVEHLSFGRRQVDGDRRERGQGLPPLVRGDRAARAGG